MLSRNITPILPLFPLKISEKTDHKEPPSRRKSSRKRFPKDGIETNSGPEETQPDINTQPTKTDNDTEDDCDEFFMENVNSDMEIRTIDLYFSFIEALKKPIYKTIMRVRAKTKAFLRNSISIKLNRHILI